MLRKDDEENTGPGLGYMVTVIVCEIVFGILASVIVMYFSRQREFRADEGAARIMGTTQPMIRALQRLGGVEVSSLPKKWLHRGLPVGVAGVSGLPAIPVLKTESTLWHNCVKATGSVKSCFVVVL